MKNNQFIRFLFFNGLAALANIGSRVLFSMVMSYQIAVIFAYLVGMTIAFTFSKLYVFPASDRSVKEQYTRFAIVNVFAVIQVWCISVGLASYIFPKMGFSFYPELTAHIIGVGFPVITSYYGHKLFTFKSK